MENDTNEYYVSYHVKGWFDCCWITPKIRLPKYIGRGYINGVVDNMNKMEDSYSHDKENAIIVDMDSTLCFNTTKRPFWGDGAAESMLTDIPNKPICDLVQIMHMQNFKILIVTGREGAPDIMEATKTWLKDHYIPYDDIFFRPYKDYSKGAPTKEKIYKEKIEPKYNVWFVLDDNYKCVQMYRGLTVLQPNEGKF